VYYLKPKRAIVFDKVSGPLSRFRRLATTTPSFEEAAAAYAITPLTNDGRLSTYALVPRKTGTRVTELLVTVDDASLLITREVWRYGGGGILTFDEHYQTVGTYRLQSTIDITARFPGYSVDGTIHLSGYRTNVAVPPAVFAGT
jgi:hypothetical protein